MFKIRQVGFALAPVSPWPRSVAANGYPWRPDKSGIAAPEWNR